MRDEKEERKKQARSNKQTRQSNTAHPRQSLYKYIHIIIYYNIIHIHVYTLGKEGHAKHRQVQVHVYYDYIHVLVHLH